MMPFSTLILAGGLGTRLRPIISDIPKSLSPINGRPFLCYLLDQLVNVGTQEVILCTGYCGELVVKAFGNNYKGLTIKYSHEETPLGTGGALRNAIQSVSTDSVLVMNGDSYCGIDLNSFLKWNLKKKYDVSIVLVKVDDISRYGTVKFASDYRILSFEEKSAKQEQGWINSGIYMFRKSVLEKIPSGMMFSLERELFPELVEKGLYGFPADGKFIDIGTPDSYLLAEKFFGANC